MEGEHFGMATAEMTRAGCIVFGHSSGGTPEVLNGEADVLWTSEDEAVSKIVRLTETDAIRARLTEHTRQFSTETFVERLREIVAAFT
jgi:glycosyltransferase involved in cell wall biosynthesis